VIVTHAGEQLTGTHLDQQQCVELAALGAHVELTAQLCVAHRGTLPNPAQGLRDCVDGLWAAGVSESDLRLMASDNGARLLGLKDALV